MQYLVYICLLSTKLSLNVSVYPSLRSLNVSVYSTSQKNNKLQAVQNFACRIVSGTRKFDHVTPILKQLRWLPVAKQLEYRSAVMAFKCMAGYAPKYLSSKFSKRLEISQRKTRNCDNLNIPFCKLSTGQRSFHYRTVKCRFLELI